MGAGAPYPFGGCQISDHDREAKPELLKEALSAEMRGRKPEFKSSTESKLPALVPPKLYIQK